MLIFDIYLLMEVAKGRLFCTLKKPDQSNLVGFLHFIPPSTRNTGRSRWNRPNMTLKRSLWALMCDI